MTDPCDALIEALAAAFDAGLDWLAEQPPGRLGVAIGLIVGIMTIPLWGPW